MTTKHTVASFGTAMLDLFAAASQRELALPMPSYQMAIYQRQQIYRCRVAMRREEHHMLFQAEDVTIPDPDCDENGQWWLRPKPVGAVLRNALKAAGVESLADTPLPEIPPSTAGSPSEHLQAEEVISRYLSNMGEDKKEPIGPGTIGRS